MFKNNNNYDIPSYIEECIIQYWLRGYTRDKIAESFNTSKGTVSNIWAKYRKKLGHYDADALRELGKQLLRQNMTAEDCSIGFRVSKIMKILNIPDAKTEEFLTAVNELTQKMGISSEILRDALIEFVQISDKVPFSEIASYLQKTREEIGEAENKKKQVQEEKHNLDKEKLAKDEQVRSALREANTTLFHLKNFIDTKIKLAKFGIVVEDTDKFTRCVEGIARYSNYDPFKVIEKFSDQEKLEKEIENQQKKKYDLEMHIEKLKEKELEYEERLNLKSIKLKNLEEFEKTGLTIQELKKLKMLLIEIAVQHKITNIEQLKAKFFELFEKLEDRVALENTNNSLLKASIILENQVRINRQTLHCQDVVGPILKNLFEKGITEIEIVAVKALIDILLYNSSTTGNNIAKTNIKYENFANAFNNNNNWRKEYEKLKCPLILNLILVLILNLLNLDKIPSNIDRFRTFYSSSFPIFSGYENSDSDVKKLKGVTDTIMVDKDTIIQDKDTFIDDNDAIRDYIGYKNSSNRVF
jgi:hypothetical protein